MLDKNSKEAFIKKLQMCMKHYDYKDETKDVKGKVSNMLSRFRLNASTPSKNSNKCSKTKRTCSL